MAGSTYGTIFKISTWGESHGMGIGVTIDGCPAGLPINEKTIQKYLDRRKPGQTRYSTKRKEADEVSILSGVFDGKTTGTPIELVVFNKTQRSDDYSEIASYYRPGHADYGFDKKYGFRDYRGGGRSSGRETIGRVAAGAIACEILKTLNINITAYTKSIGNIEIDYNKADFNNIDASPLRMPDLEAGKKAEEFLEETMKQGDSVGGIIECIIKGVPAGIGEPVFEKLDANLAKAIFSIGAVKGFEIGAGFNSSLLLGSQNNDGFLYTENKKGEKKVVKHSNNAGGILGGISDGSDIVFRAAVKPTPSIFKTQETINKSGENISINIKGRHDPIIVPRAVAVVEAMSAITLLDLIMVSMTSRLDYIKDFFENKN